MSSYEMAIEGGESDGLGPLVGAQDTQVVSVRRRWGQAGAVAALLALVGCTAVAVRHSFASSSSVGRPAEGVSQLVEIAVSRPRAACSKTGASCTSTKCCKISGYQCFERQPGQATCMKKCVPGVDGSCLTQSVMAPAERSAVTNSATNLFCFSFYTQDTGSTKQNSELELLRTNLFLGSSIFGCESWRVYSDVSTWLSPGQEYTVKVDDVDGEFHYAKRKLTGTWINAGIFMQVWKHIKSEGLWATRDWTVKVDADAVFLPSRLRTRLEQHPVTANGIYLVNCKFVKFGFFGNTEVISRKAVETYLANIDDCKMALNWKGSEKVTGNEPWGEDLFAQRCMNLHGVDKVEDFDITMDGLCEAFRPKDQRKNKKWQPDCATTKTPAMHPFKHPQEYFDCLKATQGIA